MDYEKLGLGDFGKPGAYIARQLSRWTKQYQLSETQKIVEMDRLIEWLPAHLPPQERNSIVHGDYRLDNMILHPTEAKVDRRARLGIVHDRRSAGGLHLSSDAVADAAGRNDRAEQQTLIGSGSEGARNPYDGRVRRNVLPQYRPRHDSEHGLLRVVQFLPACGHSAGHCGSRARRHSEQRACNGKCRSGDSRSPKWRGISRRRRARWRRYFQIG